MLFLHEKNKQSELFHQYTDCSAELGKINEPHLYSYQDCAIERLVLWGPYGLKRAHGKPYNANYLYYVYVNETTTKLSQWSLTSTPWLTVIWSTHRNEKREHTNALLTPQLILKAGVLPSLYLEGSTLFLGHTDPWKRNYILLVARDWELREASVYLAILNISASAVSSWTSQWLLPLGLDSSYPDINQPKIMR